ncbi:chromosome partitioning ATPase [Vibrio inusitatus NBRC 102082]|uniref:Chromosome partitioning ATPase n=1 Tax=Vibrio inusitatus NBRC 102082 TaxID=1219070 RepID=A0A4Y3HTC6_9VIBR|nr:CpsD/CapB family tyrosine-protein kinase [Vibrio inusitatus]GEA50336.1 chromosome partitioning ATPase [Vibrio inusitatus NBRC 102082]
MSITRLCPELEQTFLKLELAKTRSICITGNKAGCGVTRFTSTLAEHYMLAGYRTLLIDLNLDNPAFEPALVSCEGGGDWITNKYTMQLFSGCSVPTTQSEQMSFRDPRALGQKMKHLLCDYDRIIVDAGALNNPQSDLPSAVIANACEATLLTVTGGETTKEELTNALSYLNDANAKMCGIIINQYSQQTLSQQLLSVINRRKFLPSFIKQTLQNVIKSASILNHTV